VAATAFYANAPREDGELLVFFNALEPHKHRLNAFFEER